VVFDEENNPDNVTVYDSEGIRVFRSMKELLVDLDKHSTYFREFWSKIASQLSGTRAERLPVKKRPLELSTPRPAKKRAVRPPLLSKVKLFPKSEYHNYVSVVKKRKLSRELFPEDDDISKEEFVTGCESTLPAYTLSKHRESIKNKIVVGVPFVYPTGAEELKDPITGESLYIFSRLKPLGTKQTLAHEHMRFEYSVGTLQTSVKCLVWNKSFKKTLASYYETAGKAVPKKAVTANENYAIYVDASSYDPKDCFRVGEDLYLFKLLSPWFTQKSFVVLSSSNVH
jgi:hypothetical protein